MAQLKSDLGGQEGYGEGVFSTSNLAAGNVDDGSVFVDISSVFGGNGLTFFDTDYSGLYVNSNGLITFDGPDSSISGTSLSDISGPSIAPFWADHNLNNGGEIYWDVDPDAGKVTITWSNVAPYSGTGANTYQVELKDNGNGDFETRIIYDKIEWTDGDGKPAIAGITDGGSNIFEITGSGDPDALGNFPDSKFTIDNEDNGNGTFKAAFEDGEPDFKDGTVDGGGGNDNFVLSVLDGAGDAVTTAADKILAGGGDDYVDGNDGDDTIDGGSGSDTLLGGEGADVIFGDGEEGETSTTVTTTITNSNMSDTTSGFTVTARNVVGGNQTTASDANLSNSMGGFGAGGTVSDTDSGMNSQLAYDLASGLSEELIIDFDDEVEVASFSFQSLYSSSYGEQGQWTIYNDGVQVAQSTFTEGVSGTGSGTVDISGYGSFDQIVFSSLIQTDGTDGSDYMLTSVSFESVQGSDANNDSIDGGAGTDSILGGLGADTVLGGTGDDTIFGEDGDDYIDGGADNDLVLGGDGNDVITGGEGADTLEGGDGDDYIDGGVGDDVLKTGLGQDTLVGGEGNDTLFNSAGNDSLVGGVGDDSIVATAGDDTLEGGSGADTMSGGSENDSIVGGTGDDVIYTGLGNDEAFGGDDADTFHVNGAEGVQFNQSGTDGVASSGNFSDFPTNAFSFEIQFSSDGTGPTDPTFVSYAVAGESNELLIYADSSDNLQVSIGGNVLDTGASITGLFDGQPHSLAATWDSATGALEIYADGASIFSGIHASGSTLTQGGTLVFGQEQDSVNGDFDTSQIFQGEIFNAKLFDDVRTPAEIASDAGDHEADTSNPNLIAGWVPDAVTGGLTDLTGNHTMTMSGDTQVVTMLGGNDTIVGGEGGTDDDTIDLSTLTGDVTVTFTGDEAGTITDGINTVTFSEIEELRLTEQADILDASDDSTGITIDAGAGADTITTGSGADSIDGNDDGDTFLIEDGFGADTIEGGEGVSTGTDTDRIDFSAMSVGITVTYTANEAASATDGTDTLTFTEVEALTLTGHGDSVDGSTTTSAFSIDGAAGNDTLTGGSGDDTLAGGDGDDLISGGAGNDFLTTGLGQDTLLGGDGDDTLMNSDGDDSLDGGAGDDSIVATGGEDTLRGGTGADTMDGGDDADTFIIEDGFGNDVITGGEGTTDPGDEDFDTIDLSALSGPVTVTFTGDEAGTITDGTDTITFSEIENLILSDSNDSVDGSAADAISVAAGDGDDTVIGGNTTNSVGDSIDGGDGNDSISGFWGADTIDGGAGDDTIDGGDQGDLIDGGAGNDLIDAGEEDGIGDDDTIYGGDGNDTIISTETDSRSEDLIFGDAGDDSISLQGGSDTIDGGDGDDTISGGTGDDSVTGGAGNDTFVYTAGDGNDTITDFNTGNTGTLDDGDSTNNDFINLSGYYDHITELHADQADDGVLNQSNATDTRGQTTDYSDNDQFGAGDSLTFSGASADNSSFTAENTGVVCFTSGTAIRTPRGDVLIDELRAGDLVNTLDNGPQPIRWIGKREIGHQALVTNPKLRPVLINKGEFGAERNLLVSRQHALLLNRDQLVRAIHLTEVKGMRARIANGRRQVTYIHLMFDAHEIIFAENVPAESFYPGPMAMSMLSPAAREELSLIFPETVHAPDPVELMKSYGQTARTFVQPSKSLSWAHT